MSVSLTIGGVDKTDKVEWQSLRIDNILTNKRDKCGFSMLSHDGNPITPIAGQEVIITLDATRIFGGIITEVEQEALAYKLLKWNVSCDDYTRLLDKRLVPDTFQNQTVGEIITQIQTLYMPSDITIANVDCDLVIKYIAFNYKPISACIADLAKLVGFDWYIDYSKDIHFFDPVTDLAPFDINDDDGSVRYDSLVIRRDNSQVRNTVIVRGGTFLGNQFTTEIEANGTDFVYPLGYKYSDFSCTLTGDPLSIGIDYLDDPNAYDALYNFNEKILRFKDADTPTAGSIMRIGGKPNLPVIAKVKSITAIATMSAAENNDGVYEYLITDKNINTKEGARQRAAAEIVTYGATLSDGEFVTETAGLKAGMRIRVNSTSRSVDEYFVINKVTLTQWTKNTFIYKVSLITTKSFDFIDMLKKLLLSQTKEVEIDENEIIDQVFVFEDAITVADSLGTFSTHSTNYTWGPSSQQGNWGYAGWA